jgi:hypothetical protein
LSAVTMMARTPRRRTRWPSAFRRRFRTTRSATWITPPARDAVVAPRVAARQHAALVAYTAVDRLSTR